MKKLILVFLLFGILAGCTANNIPDVPAGKGVDGTLDSAKSLHSFDGVPNGAVRWDAYVFPFPKPDTNDFKMSVTTEKTLFCYDMNSDKFTSYKKDLLNDDWIMVHSDSEGRENPEDAIYYTFVKDNQMLYIVNQTYAGDGLNYIRMTYKTGYNGTKRIDAITKEDAIPLIQNLVDSEPLRDYEKGSKVSTLIELNIPNAYEKAKMQVFYAYGDNIIYGSFIICNGKAMRTIDTFKDTCLVDIDLDGEYELMSISGFGSGIWTVVLSAYKFGIPEANTESTVYPAYQSIWSTEQYTPLTLVKQSETYVSIYSLEKDKKGELTLSKNYGALVIENEKLIPTNMDAFPFEEAKTQ